MMSAILGMNAQTAYQKAKVFDNTSVALFGGATTNLDLNSVFPVNAQVGLKVGKQFTPVFGMNVEGVTFLNDRYFGDSYTVFKAINVGLNGTVNLTNLFCGYNPNKVFELSTEAGLGWLRLLNSESENPDMNELSAKTGLVFAWNLGSKKAWQLYAEPVVYWNLTNTYKEDFVQFNKHFAQLGLQVGLAYKFRTSNGAHNFKVYNVGEMQNEINSLRAELAKKPKEVVKEVTKEVVVEKQTTHNVGNYVVYFMRGSAQLSELAKKTLDTVNTNDVVVVKGYADEVGNETFNQKLSEKRAEVVAKYLRDRGLTVESTTGYGEAGDVVARVVTVTVK